MVFKSPDLIIFSQVVLYENTSNMNPILYIGGQEGVGCWPQKRRLLKGVIMLEETWADKGRYPLIKSENRGDVVYE